MQVHPLPEKIAQCSKLFLGCRRESGEGNSTHHDLIKTTHVICDHLFGSEEEVHDKEVDDRATEGGPTGPCTVACSDDEGNFSEVIFRKNSSVDTVFAVVARISDFIGEIDELGFEGRMWIWVRSNS